MPPSRFTTISPITATGRLARSSWPSSEATVIGTTTADDMAPFVRQ